MYCLSHIIFQRFNTTMRFEGVIFYTGWHTAHTPLECVSHSTIVLFRLSMIYHMNNMWANARAHVCVSAFSCVRLRICVPSISIWLTVSVCDSDLIFNITITRHEFQKHTDNNKNTLCLDSYVPHQVKTTVVIDERLLNFQLSPFIFSVHLVSMRLFWIARLIGFAICERKTKL